MTELEDTLRDMKTDYLDLWVCHEVGSMDEVDRIFAPGARRRHFAKPGNRARRAILVFRVIATPRCICA